MPMRVWVCVLVRNLNAGEMDRQAELLMHMCHIDMLSKLALRLSGRIWGMRGEGRHITMLNMSLQIWWFGRGGRREFKGAGRRVGSCVAPIYWAWLEYVYMNVYT